MLSYIKKSNRNIPVIRCPLNSKESTRFYQQFQTTIVYAEREDLVYFTHDDHLLNWKRAFIDKEAPKDGHHYRDNYFSFKDVKYCDSNYFIALGYYHIVCDGKSYDLPGWYKMYFDVEKDSKQYKEIKEKNRLQIEEAIQGQKLSKKNE